MRYFTLYFTLLFIFFCSQALAQEVRITLPKVATTTVTTGVPNPPLPDGQYKCLATPQWKQTLSLSAAYQGLFNWRLETQGILIAHDKNMASYELVIRNLNTQLDLEKDHSKYLAIRLGEVESSIAKQSFRTKIERFALYGIILGELVIISVMGIKGAQNQY